MESLCRREVTAKSRGEGVTRKRKLLEKPKEGKKRMKSIGYVNMPQEAFIEVLKREMRSTPIDTKTNPEKYL